MNYFIKLKFIIVIVFAMYSIELYSVINESEIEVVNRTYGYIMGQEYNLTKIENEYPELKIEVIRARLNFNSSFGRAKKIIESELETIFGDYFNTLNSEALNQISKMVEGIDFDKNYAIDFLQEVNSRAEGYIESPVLETLLTYQFIDNPSEEFSRGFLNSYTTKGHQKSKGITIKAKVPLSWKQEEAERPNIVQKFISNNGKGLEVFLFMVKDLGLPEDYIITKEELNEFFTVNELKQMIPENSDFVSAQKIYLDGQVGGQIIFSSTIKRLDFSIGLKSIHYITIVEGKMFFLQCMISSYNNQDLSDRFNLFLPLFKKVANSLVFPDQYIKKNIIEAKRNNNSENSVDVITENNVSEIVNDEIKISVTREPTNGLTEEHFKDPEIVKIIEKISLEKIMDKIKQTYLDQNDTEGFDYTDYSINSDSWNLEIDGKNFVVMKINFEDLIQLITIIGIKNDVFIKISGIRNGSLPIPHSYGPCAKKMEEVFEINFPKLNPVNK
jgi:hypothetical protein